MSLLLGTQLPLRGVEIAQMFFRLLCFGIALVLGSLILDFWLLELEKLCTIESNYKVEMNLMNLLSLLFLRKSRLLLIQGRIWPFEMKLSKIYIVRSLINLDKTAFASLLRPWGLAWARRTS